MFHTQLAHLRGGDAPTDNQASTSEKYLLVASRGTFYAIDVACVREIHALPALKDLPQSPHGVAGVINVRGEVLPVIDLASRLRQTLRSPQLSDGLVVLQIAARRVALWVEEVRDIKAFTSDQIGAAPFVNEYSLVSRLTHLDGEVVFLLQTSRLLEDEIEPEELHSETRSQSRVDTSGIALRAGESSVENAIFAARAQRLSLSSPEIAQSGALSLSFDAQDSTSVARVVIGGEERGVVLTQVREFCALEKFTVVPCCPPHIVGQMNLRGEVVTLLDIAPYIGLASLRSHRTHGEVIVVKTENARGETGLVGIVIENVSDVLSLREHEMRAVPASSRAADKLCGAILHDERWIPVLDLPAILSDATFTVDETV